MPTSNDGLLRGWHSKIHFHDIHATILHLMGVDHKALTYFHQGREESLTDVGGRVVREVMG